MKHARPMIALLLTLGLTLPAFADRYDKHDRQGYSNNRANYQKIDHSRYRYDRYDDRHRKHLKKHLRQERKYRRHNKRRDHERNYYRDNRRHYGREYYLHNYRPERHRHDRYCRHHGRSYRHNTYKYRDDDYYKWIAGAIIVKELIHHAVPDQRDYEYRVYD